MTVEVKESLFFESEIINKVIDGSFNFIENLPVTKKSFFGDSIYDWSDKNNQRLSSVGDSKLRINWDEFNEDSQINKSNNLKFGQSFIASLPIEIIEDIKIFVFIYNAFPSLFGKKNIKGNTIVATTRVILNFIGYICKLSNEKNLKIKSLSEISIYQIKDAFESYPYSLHDVKKNLPLICNGFVVKNLKHGSLKWNKYDIENLKLLPKGKSEPFKSLSEKLFRLLSEESCKIVGNFLFAMNIDAKDIYSGKDTKINFKKKYQNFDRMFFSYVKRREFTRKHDNANECLHGKEFKSEFNLSVDEFSDILYNSQTAAQVIILLYTGMRYSEVISIKEDCLIKRDNFYLIKSTLIKGKSNNLPIDYDEWLAINIVQDAVKVLELICKCNFNKFLFSSFETVKIEMSAQPLSNNGLITRLNNFLKLIDKQKKFPSWDLHTHQFRHSLVEQLSKAEIGLPYITMQLKHAYNYFSYTPNEVTAGYGNYKKNLINSAYGLNEARENLVMSLYSEDAKITGPGAERHFKRTEAFFRGIGLSDDEKKSYLKKLASSGVPLISTGFGICTRNWSDKKELKETPPPCLGDYQCNPSICKNAVVTEENIPSLIGRLKDAEKKIKSPEFAIYKKYWQGISNSLKSSLESLGINIEMVLNNV